MIAHLIIEVVDAAATAGVAWAFYFLYYRRADARFKVISAAFAVLSVGGGVHLLLTNRPVQAFWVAVLVRLLGGLILATEAVAPRSFFRSAHLVNGLLVAILLALAGTLAAVLFLPSFSVRMDVPLRTVVDVLQLLAYAVAAWGFLRRPVVGDRGLDLLLVWALGGIAVSRLPFLGRSSYFDFFFNAGHLVRLGADLLLLAYAHLFALHSERDLARALREAEERYRDLLSLITTAELAASSLDLSTILSRICRELALDLNFDRCYVALKDKVGGGATLVALYDREGSLLSPPLALATDANPNFCRVIEEGTTEEIPDLKESPLTEAERTLFGEEGAALFVPLVVDGESTGALYFWRRQAGGFGPDLTRLCQTAALVAALAIRKAFDYEALSLAYLGTVDALVKSIEAKNPYTKGHSEGVSRYVELLGQALKMNQDRLARLRRAALLHDLGKLAIPSSLLSKPGPLTDREREEIRSHPQIGAEIVSRAPQLADILPAVRWHHERVDGSGYPDGLSGNQIPLEARIMAIADAFDAMTSDRPYRPRMTKEEALAELEKNAGTQFDARLVKIFRQCLEENGKEKIK